MSGQVIIWWKRSPTADDKRIAAEKQLVLRDRCAFQEGDFLEACDAVCGEVPEIYLEMYPVLEFSELSPDSLLLPVVHEKPQDASEVSRTSRPKVDLEKKPVSLKATIVRHDPFVSPKQAARLTGRGKV